MVALVYILTPVISAAAGLALESCILGGPLLMVPCRRSIHGQGADLRGQFGLPVLAALLGVVRAAGAGLLHEAREVLQLGPHVELGPSSRCSAESYGKSLSIFCVLQTTLKLRVLEN